MKEEVDLPMLVLDKLYYRFQRIDIRRGESYIVSPDLISSKKLTINQKKKKIMNALRGQ